MLTFYGDDVLVDGKLAPTLVSVRDDGVIDQVTPVDSVDAVLAGAIRLEGTVLPGFVDTHVHLNEPGRTDWEGFATGTRAAARGGVTTLVDMPLNCIPATTTVPALRTKLAAAAGQLHVDVGFWGGVVPDHLGELGPLVDAGVLGCKAFMVHSGIDEFPNVEREHLRTAMRALRAADAPLLAHAELDLGAVATGQGYAVSDYRGYLASRPNAWEDRAIELLVELCRETGCAVHIVHLSSSSSLEVIAAARSEGLPLTVETCPHYLCLAAEEVPAGATEYKCAPPIRDADNRERLWQGLNDGLIDFVITDHSPCTPDLKRRDQGDFDAAWGGVSSLQLGFANLWTEGRKRGVSLPQIASWLGESPAMMAGLATKGRIAPGFDADFAVLDPDQEFVVTEQLLEFKHKHSPYLGRRLRGVVTQTWLRGELMFDGAATHDRFAGPSGRLLLHRSRP